jgi:hypothetical protein
MRIKDAESRLAIRRRRWPAEARAADRALADVILAHEAVEPGLVVSNVGGWHSAPDVWTWREPVVASLIARLRSAVADWVGDDERGWQLWATVLRRGGYHVAHRHGDAEWSGVYYVAAGEAGRGGAITFARGLTSCTIAPQPGLLLLFPGTLLHSVAEYKGATPRISLAFNLARTA